MNSNSNVIIEISKIIGTALLTGFFTYWITFKKDRVEKRYLAYKELLEKVYGPIRKIITSSIHPGDGYEGIMGSDLISIISIIEENADLVEPRLDAYAWGFKEEIYFNGYEVRQFETIYDEDRKFLNYFNYRYNYLRKMAHLSYDPQYFYFRKIYRRFLYWFNRTERRINRKIHKLRNRSNQK